MCADLRRRRADHRLDLGARRSWGHWWVWDEPTLVSFLIVFLLYATYQPLRFSIEDPERQARYAAVFAITAGAFVPLNFIAVRLAHRATRTRACSAPTAATCPATMRLHVPRLAARHGAAVRDAVQLRDDRQAHRAQLRALRRKLARRRRGRRAASAARPRPRLQVR